MSNYKFTLSADGEELNVPMGKARNRYEYVSQYGLDAILERIYRSRAYNRAKTQDYSIKVHAIILPSGDAVTQF